MGETMFGIGKEHPIKIAIAAEKLSVSTKTIYNWIADGLLKTVKPGYVLLSEAKEAQDKVLHIRSLNSRMRLLGIGRDEKGRFVFLDEE